jgi:transposase-like protein
VTVHRWVQFIEAARLGRHAPGDRWFVAETYVKVVGRWTYLYRAVGQPGQVIDVLLSVRRDLAAARPARQGGHESRCGQNAAMTTFGASVLARFGLPGTLSA